ncbi:MAG: cobalamin-binding protein [Rhodothermales bacterium]|nr:cobalamin-binding protein [Rhodothermales bacterium]
MLRPLVLLVLACGLGYGLGCADAPADGPTPSAVTDDLGRAVTVDLPADRVLALAPSLTEALFAAGAGATLVGASHADDHPPGLDRLPRYGTYPLDLEAVVALRPDLVLATDQVNSPRDAEALAEAGVPTYFFRFDEVADVPAAVRTLGRLTGTEATADSAARALEARFERVRARTADRPRPRTLLLIGDEELFAFGDASYTQALIRLAGGESLTAGFEGENVTLQDEWVLEAQPEVIVGAFGADYAPERLLALHPAWRNLPAVRAGRVHGMDPDLLLRPGPRLVEGAERLAALLHPDAPVDTLQAGRG